MRTAKVSTVVIAVMTATSGMVLAVRMRFFAIGIDLSLNIAVLNIHSIHDSYFAAARRWNM
jgi:hypothetical protein